MLNRMLDESEARRTADAERYAGHDWDTCQLCSAHGPDMRTLTLNCGYAVHEFVPEAMSLSKVSPPEAAKGQDTLWRSSYLLRICKTCRGKLLGHMAEWRRECVSRRGVPKDSDGGDAISDPEKTIPVRVGGTTVMMDDAEYQRYREERERAAQL